MFFFASTAKGSGLIWKGSVCFKAVDNVLFWFKSGLFWSSSVCKRTRIGLLFKE